MRKQKEEIWVKIIRILLAILFIFSGLSKAIDPVASAIKMDEYFISFGLGFLHPLSMFFGVCLNIVEFTLGFMLLFRVKVKFTSTIYLLFMGFFLLLTLRLAVAEHLETNYGYDFGVVKDCGCFGQAIELSNLQTFLKNVVIIIPTLIIFYKRKRIPDIRLTELGQWSLTTIGVLIVCIVQVVAYRHLPLIDFGDWKVGNRIDTLFVDQPAEKELLYIYQNKADSSMIYLTTDELMDIYDKNLNFDAEYCFVERKDSTIKEIKRAPLQGFAMVDSTGGEHSFELLNENNQNPLYILFMHNLDEVNIKGVQQTALKDLIDTCHVRGYDFVGLTNSSIEEISEFSKQHALNFPIYTNTIDPIKGPFMVRDAIHSNPGLILLRGGVVIDKWAWRDFPKAMKEYKENLD
ncbi:MAG TPA: DoxX family protein [Bacteroidales bacterium]|nr:DoxX family protein [Bacteroidales bacterium]